MDLTRLKANLATYSSQQQMHFLNERERKAFYLNSNLLCSNIFVFKKPLDMEACYIPYSFQEIDWNQAMNADEEWIFMLNRHEYLIDLAKVYSDSKDEKYLACWKRLVFDWIERNPFSEEKLRTSWRTIDTGIRCSSWVKSLQLIHEKLRDKELQTIFDSLKLQVLFLKNQYLHRYTLSNWGTLQISGILQAVMLSEDLVPEEIVKWAWEELERQCDIQFHGDGVHWEQSPLYHFEVLFALVEIYRTAQALGIPISFDLKGLIEEAVHAAHYMIYPNGYVVPQHDSDYVFIQDVFDRLQEFQQPNLPGLFIGEGSGNFVYKTAKDFVSVWNGRHGSGHAHASLGHLNLFLNGERVLCDSGRFTYQEGPVRNFLKSGQSHSTVFVDDVPFMSVKDSWSYHYVGKALGNRVKDTADYIVLENTFSHTAYIVQRTVVFIKKDGIAIVIDHVDSQGFHTMKRFFQVNPEMKVSKQEGCWELTGKRNKAYTYFLKNANTYCQDSIYSDIYNRLGNRTTLMEEKNFEHRGISTAIFSGKPLVVKKHHIEQCASDEQPADEQFLAFHLESDSAVYDVYFAANDTVKGERVYKHNDVHLYHKLTILNDGKKVTFF